MEAPWHAYPGKYTDIHGSEPVIVFNDGETLQVDIRGVVFRGSDFDGLELAGDLHGPGTGTFVLNRRELCACRITCEVPQTIGIPPRDFLTGILHVDLRLGKPDERGGIDLEELRLALSFSGQCIHSAGTSGLFEFELLDLQKQFPPGHYFFNCFGCAYSDYFYGGQGLFGTMFCFRGCKVEYLAVRSKGEYIAVFDTHSGGVQETHVCPQFVRRAPHTGYRG